MTAAHLPQTHVARVDALQTARKAGLKTMLGCMIESSVLISAAACLAELCDYLDVDGNVLITNDPFVGVDLDKCRDSETGEIEPWAMDIVKRMATYAEVSPSGRGIHIILKGQLPPGGRKRRNIEMYDADHYSAAP